MNQLCQSCNKDKDSLHFQSGRSRYCNDCLINRAMEQRESVRVAKEKAGKLWARTDSKKASCHPLLPHHAKGLCRACYGRKYNEEYKKIQ